jgi:hypothetical protein
MGITFAVVTSLCLNALLEGMEILEDPFVAFVTLDGIDVREEFQVLHWHQLVNARNDIFKDAPPYKGPRPNAFFVARAASSHEEQKVTAPLPKEPEANIPLGNGSESTKGSRSRHRRHMLSFGDTSLLAGLEIGVDPAARDMESYRKSGYQLFKKLTTPDDENV